MLDKKAFGRLVVADRVGLQCGAAVDVALHLIGQKHDRGGGLCGFYPPFNEAGPKKPLVDDVVQAGDPTCRFGVKRMPGYFCCDK